MSRARSFRLVTNTSRPRSHAARELSAQRHRRRDIGRKPERAIDDDQRARTSRRPSRQACCNASRRRHRDRRAPGTAHGPAALSTKARRLPRLSGPPSSKKRQISARSSGGTVEARSSRSSARASPGTIAKRDLFRAAERGEFVDAVAPVIRAAEAPHEHEARLRDRILEIEIDRDTDVSGCARLASRRLGASLRAACAMRGRERAEIGIGEGQAHDLARRLREIDGLVLRVDPMQVAGGEMHPIPRRERTRPCRCPEAPPRSSRDRGPFRRSRPDVRDAARRPSTACRRFARTACPTPCTSSRIGLPRTARKPLMRRMS